MKIVLQPVTKLDNDTICHLAKDISKEIENKASLSVGAALDPHSEQHFQSAFDKSRNQWDSFKLLEWILDNFNPTRGTKILGIFDVDAYSEGFDFVFGEAFYRGRVAVVYVSRLKQEYYGLRPNRTLFYERLVKEAIHELGHAFGLRHCKNSKCVMYFSISLLDIDRKGRSFCSSCRGKYFKLDLLARRKY